jgi:hypothetical protein
MGEGTTVVTLGDVLVALKALREEVQMLRKIVQPVITTRPEKDRDDEFKRRLEEILNAKKDVEKKFPDPPYPPYWAPYNPSPWPPPYAPGYPPVTFTCTQAPPVQSGYAQWNGPAP